MDFLEELPTGCPPLEADEIQAERVVFRLVKESPPSAWDFQSHVTRWPNKYFSDGCLARAISVSRTKEHAEMTAKLPLMKRHALRVCRVTLAAGAGAVLQTGAPDHFSWWQSRGYTLAGCEVIE